MKKTVICMIALLFICNVNCYAIPCAKIPKHIEITFNGVVSVNGNCGWCNINTFLSINKIYILELTANSNPPTWSLPLCPEIQYDVISIRDGIAAIGFQIIVQRNPDNTILVYVASQDDSAVFFSKTKTFVTSDCVNVNSVENDQRGCYCSAWYDIPPWSAGINGTAHIRQYTDFTDFVILANNWLINPNYNELKNLADNWILPMPCGEVE